jgi:CRISPR-associated protein Cmr2
MNEQAMWQAKVLAYLHDPAEKALILLRGKSHEAGTVADMKALLGEDLVRAYQDVAGLTDIVKKADRWAAAADRPSLPMNLPGSVIFATEPQIIHPLTGKLFRLVELASDAHPEAVEAVSFAHFRDLVKDDGERRIDWRKTFLSLWRFGPETPAKDLGVLWNLLPADTRSPDHTIWEHLQLTSAFAGAMAAGSSGPALLLMSFGPVQSFIAQARSVSDLWAGSHLLSRMAWEAMRIICDQVGPDAVLFPNLHGVAIADLWVWKQLGHWPHGIPQPWAEKEDDTNPLFAAALPNRLVALVPVSEAEALAREIESELRRWTKAQAHGALAQLVKAVGTPAAAPVAERQIERQFAKFPEVHWAVVPWSLAGDDVLDDSRLKNLLAQLQADPAYLDATLDRLLRGEITVQGHPFFKPNPGTAYPGLFEALERLHAAAKALRPFDGEVERGYRCTLCGEREWITDNEELLEKPPGERKKESLWGAVAKNDPALAKDGEHLCGVCALKRAWPRLFVRETAETIPGVEKLDRFVLSTRSVAMSTSIRNWLSAEDPKEPDFALRSQAESVKGAALPRKLYREIMRRRPGDARFLKGLPSLADLVTEEEIDTASAREQKERVRQQIDGFLGEKAETYYALVLMDGDKLGAWLAGEEGRQKMERRFHETTRRVLRADGNFAKYLDAPRPASPSRHQAISTALNGFALNLARVVVEDVFMGKLIYAGGDDLMAMVAVHDLPGLMLTLRCAYSGVLPNAVKQADFWISVSGESSDLLRIDNGFALLGDYRNGPQSKRMFRLMGGAATASIGAVIAHHQAPLARVLADLRAAERRAKGEGNRDAFCLTLTKRAGGTTHLVGQWRLDAGMDGDMGLLLELRDLIARQVSRRAVYLLAEALRELPVVEDALAAALAYRFGRQSRESNPNPGQLAQRVARAAIERHAKGGMGEWPGPNRWLRDLLLTAEFLAREGRVASDEDEKGTPV